MLDSFDLRKFNAAIGRSQDFNALKEDADKGAKNPLLRNLAKNRYDKRSAKNTKVTEPRGVWGGRDLSDGEEIFRNRQRRRGRGGGK